MDRPPVSANNPTTGAASTIALVAVLALATVAGAADVHKAQFEGAVRSDKGSEVLAKVRQKQGRKPRIYFEAGFREQCVDGSRPQSGGVVAGGFYKQRRFSLRDSAIELETGDYYEFRVKGRLVGRELLRGRLRAVEDEYDPPGQEYPESPECSTNGWLRWRATRKDE